MAPATAETEDEPAHVREVSDPLAAPELTATWPERRNELKDEPERQQDQRRYLDQVTKKMMKIRVSTRARGKSSA